MDLKIVVVGGHKYMGVVTENEAGVTISNAIGITGKYPFKRTASAWVCREHEGTNKTLSLRGMQAYTVAELTPEQKMILANVNCIAAQAIEMAVKRIEVEAVKNAVLNF